MNWLLKYAFVLRIALTLQMTDESQGEAAARLIAKAPGTATWFRDLKSRFACSVKTVTEK